MSSENICSIPEDIPYQNPKNVRVFGTQPDNLVIQWSPMQRNDWNAPGLHYLIRYRQKKNNLIKHSNKWTEFFVEDPYVVIIIKFLIN